MEILKSKIGLLVWGVVLIISFVILPLRWAIFSIIYSAAIGPILSMLIYAPFKRTLDKSGGVIKSYAAGFIEAVVLIGTYYFLHIKFGAPKLFVPIIVATYTVNQINRIFRSGDRREQSELIWFILTVGIWSFAEFFS